jgi:hypothetical protein
MQISFKDITNAWKSVWYIGNEDNAALQVA